MTSDWWSNQYYGNWNTTSTTTTTIRGLDGKIYVGNGTVPVATVTDWKITYGDPLWGLEKKPVEGAAIPESDLAWLKRRVDEICWVPA